MKNNLVVIMADQLRRDVLDIGYTPNIDSLRQDSVEFDKAYCACPLCVPARGAFFTGLYPNNNGSLINPWEKRDRVSGDVKEGIDNLYTLMEDSWDSIHSGKQHLFTAGGKLENREDNKTVWASNEALYSEFLHENGKRKPGLLPKFKSYVPETVDGKYTKLSLYSNAATGQYPEESKYFFDEYFTDTALEALEKRDKNKPLLLNMMYLAPHPPLEIPSPWFDKVKLEDVKMPENVGSWYKYQSPLQMYNLTGLIGARYSKEEWKESWRVYLGLVSMLDYEVGRIIEYLKKEGIYDNSTIIFTSDHGEMLGSHRLFQKMCMYEESSHIPLYMKMPKDMNIEHKHVTKTVSHVDVFATICDYYGLETRQELDGVSMRALIEGDDEAWNSDKFIQFDGNGALSNFQRCIVDDRYKLIMDIFKDEIYCELYDLESDPFEKNNLAFRDEYDSVILKMIDKLKAYMRDTCDSQSISKFNIESFRKEYESIGTKQGILG